MNKGDLIKWLNSCLKKDENENKLYIGLIIKL